MHAQQVVICMHSRLLYTGTATCCMHAWQVAVRMHGRLLYACTAGCCMHARQVAVSMHGRLLYACNQPEDIPSSSSGARYHSVTTMWV